MEEPIPTTALGVESGALPISPASNKKSQWSRHRKKKSKETNIRSSSSTPLAKQQELITAHPASKEDLKSNSIYVIEVAPCVPRSPRSYEDIIGVYKLLSEANKGATKLVKQFNISETEITDIVSSFAGPKPSSQTKATRRV